MSQPRRIVKTNRREYVLDSGASFHVVARNSLPPKVSESNTTHRKTFVHSNRTPFNAANRVVEVTREADENINELDTYVYIKSVEDSPAVLR